jgi:hypothetical protein
VVRPASYIGSDYMVVQICTVMVGIAGLPRYPRGIRDNADECCGITAGMVLDVARFPREWSSLSEVIPR